MFDTLMYAKRLEAAGLTRDQAEAQINVIAEMVVDGVATKQDIALVKQDIALVRQDFVVLRQDFALHKAEISKDFAELRVDLSKEFAKVYATIHAESGKNLKIMAGMLFASTTITIGVLGLLLK